MNATQANTFAKQAGRTMAEQNNPVIDLAQRSAEMQQRDWLMQHCDGDQTAFPKLMQYLRKPIYNYLCRCGISADSRDDVFQDIFLKIHSAAATYRPSRPLKPWVRTQSFPHRKKAPHGCSTTNLGKPSRSCARNRTNCSRQ